MNKSENSSSPNNYPIVNELHADAKYYSKKYHLYKDKKHNDGWDDTEDAFRHAYARAYTVYLGGELFSNLGMTYHEIAGNLNNQSKAEYNMDRWNNQVGKEIGTEVKETISNSQYKPTKSEIKDYIAHKVMQRMRAGDLITNPNDPRKFSDYHKIKARKDELVPKYNANRNDFNNPASLLKYKRGYYKGFINDENGKDIIYTVENVGAMSDEEYNNNKKVLNAQIKKIGLPSNHDLRRPSSTGDVYVHSYTKSDGTHVTSHYRSRPN